MLSYDHLGRILWGPYAKIAIILSWVSLNRPWVCGLTKLILVAITLTFVKLDTVPIGDVGEGVDLEV